MTTWYMYDEDNIPFKANIVTAAKWLTDDKKIIRRDTINGHLISTVFLGLDHSWGEGPPLLWETMIFAEGFKGNNEFEDYQERYSSYDEALIGHYEAMEKVKNLK